MVAPMIMMWLQLQFQSFWNFVLSSASITTLIGFAAIAVAILLPKQLDFITDLRKWAFVVAVVALSYTTIAGKFYYDGLTEKQRQWDAALAVEAREGNKARADAVDTVGPVSADRSVYANDPNNRDNWKDASKPRGKVRWLESNHVFGR